MYIEKWRSGEAEKWRSGLDRRAGGARKWPRCSIFLMSIPFSHARTSQADNNVVSLPATLADAFSQLF